LNILSHSCCCESSYFLYTHRSESSWF